MRILLPLLALLLMGNLLAKECVVTIPNSCDKIVDSKYSTIVGTTRSDGGRDEIVIYVEVDCLSNGEYVKYIASSSVASLTDMDAFTPPEKITFKKNYSRSSYLSCK